MYLTVLTDAAGGVTRVTELVVRACRVARSACGRNDNGIVLSGSHWKLVPVPER
jgi:hypothetical protein